MTLSMGPLDRSLLSRPVYHPRPAGALSRCQCLGVKAASTQHSRRSPRPQNVPGNLYVDHTCIDCDTCRWMAPSVFKRVDELSAVHHQPSSSDERLAALQALLSCPTASIHTEKPQADIKKIQATFPLAIDEQTAPGVYHCGFHSEKSFGAASYFLTRPEGNILIDSPRFTEVLAKKLELMGGVRYMFLTHKDDIADHKKWQQRFQCERILHSDDIQEHTLDVEIKLQGTGPWDFIGSDVDLIHTPGHTEGCVSLLCKPKRTLFPGDHLFADEGGKDVLISHKYLFYSLERQVESLRLLIPLDFIWVLPGHGRRIKFKNVEDKNAALESLVAKEEKLLG
ncbi:hypothetical protein SELMODRAFT_140607 [Selaginella moellendorffii]|uniref:Metallo-beta-lactamase domain-containing protein n=1 Tax=Selaginella moellendorffii TaxID=88036 RepID=D8QRZ4_SELML|nr:uncharacterized protein LOC9630661 isoform X1 [Selaginella moellendorffii]EFJ37349.1 hypothetical protein SELMODRAFT_140607 [Selaginella moellendorffii]|eukprot:XP_002962089.1 uncharacterized protein LOC9630661 isoform X1 [Selaginella moellendorffii]